MSDDVIGIAVTTGVGKALRALVISEGVDVAPQFTIVPLEIDKMREVMRTQATFTMSECIVTGGGEDHYYVMMHTAPMCGDSSLCRGQVSAVDVKGNPVMRGPFMLLGGVMGNLEGLTDEDIPFTVDGLIYDTKYSARVMAIDENDESRNSKAYPFFHISAHNVESLYISFFQYPDAV